jgi:NAD(P)-dependent dehydrogenase (short-subunit alcohol dehydrogenase family)
MPIERTVQRKQIAMTGRLDGKVAIVTGAAARGEGVGNGMATALLFAREGAKVVLVNRTSDHAEALAARIHREGGVAHAFIGDVTDPDTAQRLVDETVTRFGRLDILHNNVGFARPGNAETVTLDDWNSVLDANLTSAMLCTRSAIPKMKAGGGGSVIMVSSISGSIGMTGVAGSVAYATAKAGLHGYARAVAANQATAGIRANCIIVGSVATPMVAHLGDDARERRRLAVPMQVEGPAWDIGYAALYLASDESRWVTGILLPVDGGFTSLRDRPV